MRALIFLLTFTLVACNADDSIQDQEADFAMLERMEAEIMELIDTSCEEGLECRTVAFGAKPCGGPWTYLIYGMSGTNESELLVKVENYNRVQQIINQKYGLISDCMVVLPPDLSCQDGNCTAI